jgi:hypothetical protein
MTKVNLSVKVSIAALGNPDYGSTEKTLNAQELVKFDIGKGGSKVDPLTVAQVGGCNYVKDCTVDVPVPVTYSIASELKDNIANAADKQQRNAHRLVLHRIESHARMHYQRVINEVIPAWTKDIEKDLHKTLPTDKTPTSLEESKLKEMVVELVEYWVRELGFRVAKNVNDWEAADYPELEKFMRTLAGYDRWSALGLVVPKFKQTAPKRPAIAFPSCRPKKG